MASGFTARGGSAARPFSSLKRYFEVLRAPIKRIIWIPTQQSVYIYLHCIGAASSSYNNLPQAIGYCFRPRRTQLMFCWIDAASLATRAVLPHQPAMYDSLVKQTIHYCTLLLLICRSKHYILYPYASVHTMFACSRIYLE